jgi:hypothetical protein
LCCKYFEILNIIIYVINIIIFIIILNIHIKNSINGVINIIIFIIININNKLINKFEKTIIINIKKIIFYIINFYRCFYKNKKYPTSTI